jgi:hypothetical protein
MFVKEGKINIIMKKIDWLSNLLDIRRFDDHLTKVPMAPIIHLTFVAKNLGEKGMNYGRKRKPAEKGL